MPYAKPCKYCNNVQVVWDEHLQGPNKFKEVQTNQPHTRERCDQAKNTPPEQQVPMYNPQQQKEFVDYYRPQQKSETIAPKDYQPGAIQLAQLVTKVDNMNIALTQIMSHISNIIENAGTFKEMQELKTENQQLKEVIKKQNLSFKPANELPQEPDSYAIRADEESQQEHDQHVRDMVGNGRQEGVDYVDAEHVRRMVEKGKQASEEEELDLT